MEVFLTLHHQAGAQRQFASRERERMNRLFPLLTLFALGLGAFALWAPSESLNPQGLRKCIADGLPERHCRVANGFPVSRL